MILGVLPVVLILGIISLAMSLVGIAQGNATQALLGMFGALFFFISAPMAVRVFRTRRRSLPHVRSAQTTEGETALLIPAWQWFPVILSGWLVAAILTGVGYGIMLAGRSYSDSARAARSYIVVGLLALAIILATWLLVRTVASLKSGKALWLTRSGVGLDNGLMKQTLDWDEILDIHASTQPRFATIKLQAQPGSVEAVGTTKWPRNRKSAWLVEIYTLEFNVDSALLYHLINFYRRHPEARQELASDAVVGRIRCGDLQV